jgi:phosphoribosylformimino-5-aminoimidazole carboxamide ribotide isomerase
MINHKSLNMLATNSPMTDFGFELIPAIDVKGGKCVRLRQGRATSLTEYGDDPLAMAHFWQEQGAGRLHLVDLDGAFSGKGIGQEMIRSIFSELTIPVQFGGGLRTIEQIEKILDLGADRVILGTLAVNRPDLVEAVVKLHRGSIVVGIDARAGNVMVHGWVDRSELRAADLALRMKDLGVERIIYTDISRDGMLEGVNIEETEELARKSGLPVIASGGVAAIEDVRKLWERRSEGIEGVILGRALYENRLDFSDLNSLVSGW